MPLYDTLGPDAVKYIIGHAAVSLVFADAAKMRALVEPLKVRLDRLGQLLKTRVGTAVLTGSGLAANSAMARLENANAPLHQQAHVLDTLETTHDNSICKVSHV